MKNNMLTPSSRYESFVKNGKFRLRVVRCKYFEDVQYYLVGVHLHDGDCCDTVLLVDTRHFCDGSVFEVDNSFYLRNFRFVRWEEFNS